MASPRLLGSRPNLRRMVAGLVLVSSLACGGSGGEDGGSSASLSAPYRSLTLALPSELPEVDGGDSFGSTVTGHAFRGDILNENVERVDTRARFRPNWTATTPVAQRKLAAAFYFVDMQGLERVPALLLNWQAAPATNNLWVGLADWDEDRWVWRRLADVGRIALPSHDRFRRDSDGRMGVVLLVVGDENAVLGDISSDEPELSNGNYPLGVNLELLTDYNRCLVFTDVFRMSRDWIPQLVGTTTPWDTGATIKTDENGWVTELGPGESAMAILMLDQAGNYPDGRYVCLYDGDGGNNSDAFLVLGNGRIVEASRQPGRFEINITQSNSGTWFKIEKVNPDDPIRNIRVIMPGFETTYNTSHVFHPDFLASLEPFRLLRCMEWGWTKNSPIITWDDRTPPGYCRVTMTTGAPIETMVDLCNTAQKDLWLCIPHMADDNYVRQACRLVRDRLDPNLRLFLEYSNEVWNFMFVQAQWAWNQGRLLWPNDTAANIHYYGLRAGQVMDIATDIFAGEQAGRLIRVLATQNANPWVGQQIMDQEITGPGDHAFLRADALAVAPYFGDELGRPEHEVTTQAMTVAEILDACALDIASTFDVNSAIRANHANATARGLSLIAYEGGQHLAGVGDVANNQVITDKFIAANRDPRMRQLYSEYMTQWTNAGGTIFFTYSHSGSYSKHGMWGLLESQYLPIQSAHKWQGVTDWLADVLQ